MALGSIKDAASEAPAARERDIAAVGEGFPQGSNLRNENWAEHHVVDLVDEAIASFAIGPDDVGLAIGPEPATGDVASEVNALDCRAVQVG
jgi:hypothetical protein